MKPKPLDLLDTGSFMTTASWTVPYTPKYFRNLSEECELLTVVDWIIDSKIMMQQFDVDKSNKIVDRGGGHSAHTVVSSIAETPDEDLPKSYTCNAIVVWPTAVIVIITHASAKFLHSVTRRSTSHFNKCLVLIPAVLLLR